MELFYCPKSNYPEFPDGSLSSITLQLKEANHEQNHSITDTWNERAQREAQES